MRSWERKGQQKNKNNSPLPVRWTFWESSTTCEFLLFLFVDIFCCTVQNYLVSMHSSVIYTTDEGNECGGFLKVRLCLFIYGGGFKSSKDLNYNNPEI